MVEIPVLCDDILYIIFHILKESSPSCFINILCACKKFYAISEPLILQAITLDTKIIGREGPLGK